MAGSGLTGIDETVHQTHTWLNEIAEGFHGDTHEALQILRGFLHALREHLPVDESAQLSAQLPLLIRGLYFEGWNPGHTLHGERSADAFVGHVIDGTSIRPMDGPRAAQAAWSVVKRHVSAGEVEDVFHALPGPVRELLAGET